jgi:hypothetical protein
MGVKCDFTLSRNKMFLGTMRRKVMRRISDP